MFTPKRKAYAPATPKAPKKKAKKVVPQVFKNTSTTVSLYKSPISPVPQTKRCTLRYAEANVSLDPSATIPAEYFFRANDLYDPNYTGTGHQPLGFDQWMNLYGKFTVVNSKITVKWTNGADATTADWLVMCRLVTSPTSNNTTEILESNRCCWQAKERESIVTLVNSYSHRREHGRLPLQDASMFGTVTTSPTNLMYFHIACINAVISSDVTPLIATVVIEYDTLFFDPIVLSSS